MIRWSKVRTRVEALFAESVRGRVGFHTTCYRRAHDEDGRAWITLDGEEIINLSSVEALHAWGRLAPAAAPFTGDVLRHLQVHFQSDLGRAMFDYPSLPFEHVLTSEDRFIRALGALDRRLGRRRALHWGPTEADPLVRRLLSFRFAAEGWPPGSQATADPRSD